MTIFFSSIDRINVRRVFEKDFREQRFTRTTNLSFAFSYVIVEIFFNPFIFFSLFKVFFDYKSFFLSFYKIFLFPVAIK